MLALSILFVVIHIYWFCYECIVKWGINISVVDKILANFQRTAGLLSNILCLQGALTVRPSKRDSLNRLKSINRNLLANYRLIQA